MTDATLAAAPTRRARRRAASQDRPLYLLLLPATLLLAVFYLYPLFSVLIISVTEPQPGLDNYARLTSPSVVRVMTTTLRICLISTAVTVVLSYVVAYVFTQSGKVTQRIMLMGILLPLWVSALVRAFSWITLLRREGLINTALMEAGIISQPLPMLWNEFGVTLGIVHYMMPLGILPLMASLQNIQPSLLAAARGLGASQGQTFRLVYLPLSMTGIVASSVLVFIFSLGFYVTPALMGGGRVVLITEYISIQIIDILQWGLGTTLAVTLMVVIGLVLAIVSRVVDMRTLFGAK